MAQTKIMVSGLSSKEDAEKLVEQTSSVAEVRFVNVNVADGYVVVTHGDAFSADAFKAAVSAAGFSA